MDDPDRKRLARVEAIDEKLAELAREKAQLEAELVEMDEQFQQQTGMTIAEIRAKHGKEPSKAGR